MTYAYESNTHTHTDTATDKAMAIGDIADLPKNYYPLLGPCLKIIITRDNNDGKI